MADVIVEIFGDNDPFKKGRDSAKQFLKVMDSLVKKSQMLGSTLKKEVSGIEFKGLKDVQKLNQQISALNKTLKSTNDLRDAKVKLNKQVLEAEKKAIKTAQDGIKVSKQEEVLRREKLKNAQQLKRNLIEQERLAQSQLKTKRDQINTARAEAREIDNTRKARLRDRKTLIESANSYKKLTRQTNAAQARFKRLAAQYGVTSKQAQKALRTFNRLDDSLRKINNAAKDGRRDVGRYGLALGGLKGGFAGLGTQLVGALGVVGGVQLFAQVLRDSFNIVRDFGAEQSNLAGILGKTKGEISELTELSKELGGSTVFTATEVSKAQIELAKLGLGAEEISSSIKGVLDASVALGAGIPETAALVASSLKAFNLEASESDRIAAVLGVSTTKSSLDFAKLETALGNVAPAAAAFGLSIEETTALLGLITDKGIDASRAGTQLSTVLIKLRESGLTLEEGLDKVANSQDKLTTANKLFGKLAVTTVLALADQRDKIKESTEAITDQDEALKALIAERLNNLDGDLKILSSTWQKFILGVEDGSGVINNITRGAIAFLITAIGEAQKIITSIVKPFQDLFAELGKIADALGITVGEFNAFNILIQTTKFALLPIRVILKSIAFVLTTLAKATNLALDAFGFLVDEVKDLVSNSEFLNAVLENLGKAFDAVKGFIDDVVTSIKTFIAESDFLSGAVKVIKDEFDIFLGKLSEIKTEITGVIASIIELKNELLDDGGAVSSAAEEYDKFGKKLTAAEIVAKRLAETIVILNEETGNTGDGADELTGAIEKQAKVVADLEEAKKKAAEGDIARLNIELIAARAELKRLQDLGIKQSEEEKRLTEFNKKQQELDRETAQNKIDLDKETSRKIEALRLKQIQSNSIEDIERIEKEITKIRRKNTEDSLFLEIDYNSSKVDLINEYTDVVKNAEDKVFNLEKDNIDKRQQLKDNAQNDFISDKKERLELEKESQEDETKILEKGLDDRLKAIKDFEENVSKLLDVVEQGLANQTQKRLDSLNRSLEDNRKIQEELREEARNGSLEAQESIALEQKKEAELEQQRLKLEKQQRQRELAFAFLKILNANLSAYQAKVLEDPNTPNTALIDSVAQFGLASGFTSAIAGNFIEGTEDIGKSLGTAPLGNVIDNYVGETGGKLFRFDGREAILSPEQNKKRGGLSNDKTVEIAHQYLKGDLVEKSKVFDTAISMTNALMALSSAKQGDYTGGVVKALTGEIRGLRSDIKKLPDAMPVSHSGFNNKTGMVEEIVKRQGRVNTVLERLNKS